MLRSICCHAGITLPGWPESDICADCGEHCGAYDEDEELYCEDCEWWQDDFEEACNYYGE